MKKTASFFWGIILVLLGVMMILDQQGILPLAWGRVWWPIALITLAILFHIIAFAHSPRSPGLLVPGGILLVYGGLFFYCAIRGWNAMSALWPLFLLGPALGLAELKLFSGGREGSWIPVVILSGVGGFFLVRQFTDVSAEASAAALLILLGVFLVARQLIRGRGRASS
ncbi:MAG: hypothetical protein GX549_03075 [Clostridiales bacterium]|nr:hypothetical protein [Clostridiales bacterium]